VQFDWLVISQHDLERKRREDRAGIQTPEPSEEEPDEDKS
jgi:hypothetical protein